MKADFGLSALMRRIPREWALPFSLVILVVGWLFKPELGDEHLNGAMLIFAFVGFFVGAVTAAFSAVRHAEHLAHRFGEPYGTLILTLSAIAIEVVTVITVMLHGSADPHFARDTMFSVLMIVLNGVIGVGLLLGGLRHHEQSYNLQGTITFLSVLIPLTVLALILPNYTRGGGEGIHTFGESIFLIIISFMLYGVFIAIQTRRHRSYFLPPEPEGAGAADDSGQRGWLYHAFFLLVYLLLVVLTAKLFALPLDIGIDRTGLPSALGALAVAILVLAPEGVAAIAAARANHMQRSVNIGLGTALSTISLTVPAVLIVDLTLNRSAYLGLSAASTVLLVLTFGVSMLTFTGGRTNMLQGLVHIALFFAYIVLIFFP
ncbi:MAG: calcium:proton antiporter [Gammaproteobacteria bacterium]|nr:calcium:proton antiporter [Nitrococcus sp.]MDN5864419.1 calcium:proton antiporter [Gammaproteobacteria bacterium]